MVAIPVDRYKSVTPARQECLEIPRVAHEAVAELRVIRMLGRCVTGQRRELTLFEFYVLPANLRIFRVGPRGFEPLTSAVQSQIHNVVVVR